MCTAAKKQMVYAHHLWKRMFLSNRRRSDRFPSKA